jgi:hypothetical protein
MSVTTALPATSLANNALVAASASYSSSSALLQHATRSSSPSPCAGAASSSLSASPPPCSSNATTTSLASPAGAATSAPTIQFQGASDDAAAAGDQPIQLRKRITSNLKNAYRQRRMSWSPAVGAQALANQPATLTPESLLVPAVSRGSLRSSGSGGLRPTQLISPRDPLSHSGSVADTILPIDETKYDNRQIKDTIRVCGEKTSATAVYCFSSGAYCRTRCIV